MRSTLVAIALLLSISTAADAGPRVLAPGLVHQGSLVAAKTGGVATDRWTLAAKKGERWVFSVRGDKAPPTIKIMHGTEADAVLSQTVDARTALYVTRHTSKRTLTIDIEAPAEGPYEVRADAWTGWPTVQSLESYSGTTYKGTLTTDDPHLGGRPADTWELGSMRDGKKYSVTITAASPVEAIVGTVDRGYKALVPLAEARIGTSIEVPAQPSGVVSSFAVTVRAVGKAPINYQIKAVEASATAVASGPEKAPPGAGTLVRGQVSRGELTASDRKDLEGRPYDLWAIELAADEVVTAVIRADLPDGVKLHVGKMFPSDATKLDAFRTLIDGDVTTETGDARVTATARTSGIYVVVVESNTLFMSRTTGSYTLSISGVNDVPTHPPMAQRAKPNPAQISSGSSGGGTSGGGSASAGRERIGPSRPLGDPNVTAPAFRHNPACTRCKEEHRQCLNACSPFPWSRTPLCAGLCDRARNNCSSPGGGCDGN